jgi:hypothetical protein
MLELIQTSFQALRPFRRIKDTPVESKANALDLNIDINFHITYNLMLSDKAPPVI